MTKEYHTVKSPDELTITSERLNEREDKLRKVLKIVNQEVETFEEGVIEVGVDYEEYVKELENTEIGLRNKFKESVPIQEGISAIVKFSLFVQKMKIVQEWREKNKDASYKDIPKNIREALEFSSEWQQHVANFLFGHFNHSVRTKEKDNIYSQFKSMFQDKKRNKRINRLLFQLGTTVPVDFIENEFQSTYQSCVCATGLAQLAKSQSADFIWTKPKDDVRNKIDCIIRLVGGTKLGIQLKGKKRVENLALNLNNYSGITDVFEYQKEMIDIRDGARRIDPDLIPIYLNIQYKATNIDLDSGFISAQKRGEIMALIEQAIGPEVG